MLSDEMKEKAAEARREGYVVIDVSNPVPLGSLIKMMKGIFPTHTLDQLAITQAEDDCVVIAAKIGIQTKLA